MAKPNGGRKSSSKSNGQPEAKFYGVRMPIEMARIIDRQVKPHGPYNSPAEVIRECLRQKLMDTGLLKLKR